MSKALRFVCGCFLIALLFYGIWTLDKMQNGLIFGAGVSTGAASCKSAT